MRGARIVLRLAAATMALAGIDGAIIAQPIVTLSPSAPSLAMHDAAAARAEDAAVYANHYGVTLDIAMARLDAQEASVVETDRIAAAYHDRLAGITIEHVPDYRIVVHLTGSRPVADQPFATDTLTVPIVFRTGAAKSRDAILVAVARYQAEIRSALVDPPGMGVDPATGTLALAVGADDAAFESLAAIEDRIAAIAHVPVHAFVLGRAANLMVAGGERLESVDHTQHRVYRCTAAFLVTDGKQTGIATAAHCPDQLESVDADGIRTALPLIGAWGAGHQDVQINAVPGSLPPWFHAGADPAALRTVSTRRAAASTRAGDFVCHQGIATGFSCAEVRLTDYAPPGDLCFGPCPASWVMVDGPGCAHGDSGGPVFMGDTAYGIVKGGNFPTDGGCSAYYYMPLDYLPDGWALLVGKPARPAP